MFPLVHKDTPNPTELFQIWINLAADKKMCKPHFVMNWAEDQPTASFGADKAQTHLRVVGGELAGLKAPPPPPESWAATPANEVVIATLRMDPGAQWTMPKASAGIGRTLYFFAGDALKVAGVPQNQHAALTVQPDVDLPLEAGANGAEILLLQGKPINEPVVQHGPFVLNTERQLSDAFRDYQRTEFGGWTFETDFPTHPREAKRFAEMPDGTIERPKDDTC
jgi:redox-sensitive bicupin YhaK (pirin superfamily)